MVLLLRASENRRSAVIGDALDRLLAAISESVVLQVEWKVDDARESFCLRMMNPTSVSAAWKAVERRAVVSPPTVTENHHYHHQTGTDRLYHETRPAANRPLVRRRTANQLSLMPRAHP